MPIVFFFQKFHSVRRLAYHADVFSKVEFCSKASLACLCFFQKFHFVRRLAYHADVLPNVSVRSKPILSFRTFQDS